MFFVSGGAFNGKKEWVRHNLIPCQNTRWISYFQNQEKLFTIKECKHPTIIFEGIEYGLYHTMLSNEIMSLKELRNQFRENVIWWQEWERQEKHRRVIWIGSDISKGIVPMEKNERNWRDLTGWCYQDLVNEVEHVFTIWYGISTKLK